MFTLCHIIICDALCLKNSSWLHCHYFLSCVQRFASSSVMAILQFHLENWPGFGMTINPANKAVYINPAREPDMNFIKFLTSTYNEYSWFLPTLVYYFRHQHLPSYKGSKPAPRSQASSAQRALRQEEMCALWHGMDLIPAFGLIYLALGVIVNSETLIIIHQKSEQHFTGVVSKKSVAISMFDTWPDTGKHFISCMWLSITRFE